jgi:hypothetical protein
MRSITVVATLLATLVLAPEAHANKDKGKRGTDRERIKPGAGQVVRRDKGPKPGAGSTLRSSEPRELSPALAGLFDQLAMLQMGGRGSTHAHMFIEEAGRYKAKDARSALYSARGSYRKFQGPNNDGSIIVMFSDKSGAYVHPDGFVTPMGDNIAHEVGDLTELK